MYIHTKNSLLLMLTLSLIACDKPAVSDFHEQETSPYIKLDKEGNEMKSDDGPWACVKDKRTGLIWENKTDNEGLSHYKWTYSWYQPDQASNDQINLQHQGSCKDSLLTRCNSHEQLKAINKKQLCGVTSWRLPTKDELMSILQEDYPDQTPKLCDCFFSHTMSASYWTADHNNEQATAVNFKDGSTGQFAKRGAFYLRLVSDDKPLP